MPNPLGHPIFLSSFPDWLCSKEDTPTEEATGGFKSAIVILPPIVSSFIQEKNCKPMFSCLEIDVGIIICLGFHPRSTDWDPMCDQGEISDF